METRGLGNPSSPRRSPAVSGGQVIRWTRAAGAVLVWLASAGLLVFALRDIPLVEIGLALGRLGLGQVLALAALNLLILFLLTARWALLLRSLGHPVNVLELAGLRLVGFGISYFTPGPQFGGEPVQVDLLRRRGVRLAEAISSVFLDRLVDLLANFTFLAVGVVTVLLSGLFSSAGWGWAAVPALLLFPLAHLAALWSGRRPLTWLAAGLARRVRPPLLEPAAELVAQSEDQIGDLCQARPALLLQVLGLSALVWLLVIVEFTLSLWFLGVPAALPEAIIALTAARLAFLMPLPAGLGVLEASQVFATQSLGWDPAVGLALSLLIRARDGFLASLGVALSGLLYRKVLLKAWLPHERS